MRIIVTCFCVAIALAAAPGANGAPIVVNLTATSLGYNALNNTIYASVPFGAPRNANTLTPINPLDGTDSTPINIGFRPGQVAVSSDNHYVYTVMNDGHSVQRYDAVNNVLDLNFTMPGSGQFFQSVRQMYAVPGQPDAVLIERGLPGFSPPAVATGVWKNGVELPQTVGTGLGVGGPDILAVDETGINAYGYQNSVSSFGTWAMAMDANGIHQTQHLVNGPISGFGIGHIAAADGKLFDDHGNVYDVNNSFAKTGTFNTSGNFAVDAELGKLFSVVLSGGQNRIEVYDLNTLEHLNTIFGMAVLGPVSTSNLIRVGADGLAFTTSAGRVAIIYSAAVPEPSSWLLAMAAFPALAMFCRPRGTRRV